MEEEKGYLATVPLQLTGSQMDIVEKRYASSDSEAIDLFKRASSRLLTVNKWGDYAGISSFLLMDAHGIRVDRPAQKEDYIRIDIPGPGTEAGMGYDWVKIEDITNTHEENRQVLSMTVRPCSHPISEKEEIAHFLKSEATSTFVITLSDLCISAEEHGRNEMPNTSNGSFFDKGRNYVVGMAAKLGLSYPQWKSLVKALLQD
ncbi:hypothetical protein EZ449_03180 [Pedobacter frigidisoli]|uniref:Uncharacterized protein n=1 Tax=Pedobacter frigidisoli TaxID=2530455 RepID=A0A4R0P816_9SPHI|nr:hypothetical protein [Pedobacter frigidisoli]TCD12039.1 hypothetical protein EZ449_03180 [Pedobacter frigidisoli]